MEDSTDANATDQEALEELEELEDEQERIQRAKELLARVDDLLPSRLEAGDVVDVQIMGKTIRPGMAVSVFNPDKGYANFQVFLDGINDRSLLSEYLAQQKGGDPAEHLDEADQIARSGMLWLTSISHADHAQGDTFWTWPGEDLELQEGGE